MTQVLRCYFVDNYDQVKRMPLPRYRLIMAGNLDMADFAGKAVRFAEMTLWLDEDRIIARALTWFPLVHFDGDGRRDLGKHQQEMNLVMREMASSSESHWSELYRAERFATFRWLPSQNVLQQLQESLPHHPTQVPTHIPKENLSS
jgi:hypothetical protein